MKGGAGDQDYLAAWELVLGPIATAFAPEVVLVSAGFDAAEGDPLGGCRVTAHGYARLTVCASRCGMIDCKHVCRVRPITGLTESVCRRKRTGLR